MSVKYCFLRGTYVAGVPEWCEQCGKCSRFVKSVKESDEDCTCKSSNGVPKCFLYHAKKNYCSLDGKQHTGCIINFMPIPEVTNAESVYTGS